MLNLTDAEYRELVKAAGGEYYATLYVRALVLKHLKRRKTRK